MPSSLYETMKHTALELINSMDMDDSGNFDEARILAVRTADYAQHYGHTYMVEKARAGMYHTMNSQTLIEHLKSAGEAFQSLPHEFKSVLVDEEKHEVAVRWEIKMKTKGSAEIVNYDICWLIELNEAGTKAKSATEFIDGYARDRIAELVGQAAQNVS